MGAGARGHGLKGAGLGARARAKDSLTGWSEAGQKDMLPKVDVASRASKELPPISPLSWFHIVVWVPLLGQACPTAQALPSRTPEAFAFQSLGGLLGSGQAARPADDLAI